MISNTINNNHDYEIIFVNYKKRFFDFKLPTTYIKLKGNDKSLNINYSTWSDTYVFGQMSRNNRLAKSFSGVYRLNNQNGSRLTIL